MTEYKKLLQLILASMVFCTPFVFAKSADLQNAYAVVLPNKGAVATVQPLATQAAVNILKHDGNAIDAALAAAFTLGVVDSHNSGIGGGCFILARLANGKIIAIDGREMAPAKAHSDMYIRDGSAQADLSKTGALAIGIPGSVQALYEFQAMHGALTFSQVLMPAADMAQAGFAIDSTLANRLNSKIEDIKRFPATAKIFTNEHGKALKIGEILKQPDLAASYRSLAKEGPSWFYTGEFAKKTGNWMLKNGGIITEQDFKNYKTILREPVHSRFAGYDIYGFGPPSSGGVHVAQILNILAKDNLKSLPEVDRYHLIAEAMKLAFADRAHWLGDADFVPVPRGIIAPEYGALLRKKIDSKKSSDVVNFNMPPEASSDFFNRQINKHTTHISVADAEGNWVSITTTLNTSFGSKVVIPGTGILLNNQMDDFTAAPGVANAFGLVGAQANAIAPGKRPLSSMSPTIVLKDGAPVLSIGAAGGPTIISQVVQGLINYLALEMSLYDAIDQPRIHHQWQPNWLFTEFPLDSLLAKTLTERGHMLRSAGDFGGTQAVAFKNGHFEAVTEPRVVRRNSR